MADAADGRMETVQWVPVHLRLTDIADWGHRAVRIGERSVLVFRVGTELAAIDPRCPHMGYPLSRGTVEEGILRCHWHHWRFDLRSGGCLTAGGEDVASWPVRVVDGWVEVGSERRQAAGEVARLFRRLEEGIRTRRLFLMARPAAALTRVVGAPAVVAFAADVGVRFNPKGFEAGLTVLAAMARLADTVPDLDERDRVAALVHGMRHLSFEVGNRPPNRDETALPTPFPDADTLYRWFLLFVEEREASAGERALRTFFAQGGSLAEGFGWILEGVAGHIFLDTGHVLDFVYHAWVLLQYLEATGQSTPGRMADVAVSLVKPVANGHRHEEDIDWAEYLSLFTRLRTRLGALRPSTRLPEDVCPDLAGEILARPPADVVARLGDLYEQGHSAAALAREVAVAAVMRLARFPAVNADDWDTVHHLVTHANALWGLARTFGGRSGAVDRALVMLLAYAATYTYMTRFLNIPRYRLPWPPSSAATASGFAQELADALQQGNPDEAAELAAAGAKTPGLAEIKRIWARSVVHEDAGFHALQALDAGLELSATLAGRLDPAWPLLAGLRFTSAQRNRRLVRWETDTALKLLDGGGPDLEGSE